MERDKRCRMWQEETNKIHRESLQNGGPSIFNVWHSVLGNNEQMIRRNSNAEMDKWHKQDRVGGECVCYRHAESNINKKMREWRLRWFGHVQPSLDNSMGKSPTDQDGWGKMTEADPTRSGEMLS